MSKYAHTLLCRANLSLIVYRLCHGRTIFPGDSMRTTVKDPHPTTALSQHDGKQPAGFFFAQYVAGPLLSRGNLRSRGESGSYLNNHSVTRRLSQRGWRSKRETEGERASKRERKSSRETGMGEDKGCEARGKRAAQAGGGGPDTITWCKSNRASRNHPVRLTRPFSDWFLEERASTVNFYIALAKEERLTGFLRDPIYRMLLNASRWIFKR